MRYIPLPQNILSVFEPRVCDYARPQISPSRSIHVGHAESSGNSLLKRNLIGEAVHYESMPMQYTVIFKVVKIENFQ